MSEVETFTAVPLRKKYYDGEQVIKAVGESGADYGTMMAIYKSLSEMQSAEMDYDKGFIDGAMYAIEEVNRKINEAFYKKINGIDADRRETK